MGNWQCCVCERWFSPNVPSITINKLKFCSEGEHQIYVKWRSLEVRIWPLHDFWIRHKHESAV